MRQARSVLLLFTRAWNKIPHNLNGRFALLFGNVNVGYLISSLGYGMLFIDHDSACCLMNKILSSVLYAFLSCPVLLSRAGSDGTALGQSSLWQNIGWFWPFIYSSLGTCDRLLSLDTVAFPSDLVFSHTLCF